MEIHYQRNGLFSAVHDGTLNSVVGGGGGGGGGGEDVKRIHTCAATDTCCSN